MKPTDNPVALLPLASPWRVRVEAEAMWTKCRNREWPGTLRSALTKPIETRRVRQKFERKLNMWCPLREQQKGDKWA